MYCIFSNKKCSLFQSFFCKSLVRFILCEYFFSYLSFVKEPFVKTVAFARPQARPRPSRARHRWPRRGRSPSAVEPRDPTAARPPFKKKKKLRMDSNSLVMDSIRRIHDIIRFIVYQVCKHYNINILHPITANAATNIWKSWKSQTHQIPKRLFKHLFVAQATDSAICCQVSQCRAFRMTRHWLPNQGQRCLHHFAYSHHPSIQWTNPEGANRIWNLIAATQCNWIFREHSAESLAYWAYCDFAALAAPSTSGKSKNSLWFKSTTICTWYLIKCQMSWLTHIAATCSGARNVFHAGPWLVAASMTPSGTEDLGSLCNGQATLNAN